MTGPGLITGNELIRLDNDTMRAKEISRIPPLPPAAYTTNTVASLADIGRIVFMNAAGANAYTIPPDSTGKWLNDHVLIVCQEGAGATTIVPGAGVTIRFEGAAITAPSVLTFAGQDRFAWIYRRGANLWLATGGLTA